MVVNPVKCLLKRVLLYTRSTSFFPCFKSMIYLNCALPVTFIFMLTTLLFTITLVIYHKSTIIYSMILLLSNTGLTTTCLILNMKKIMLYGIWYKARFITFARVTY